MGIRRKGRIIAFQALYAWELACFAWLDTAPHGRTGSGEADDRPVGDAGLDFPRLLVAGTIQNIEEIDEAIRSQLEHWDFDRVTKVDLSILRVSVYALLFQTDIPATVTIDEAIDIAKEFGTEESYKFVNGVLDGIRKSRCGIEGTRDAL